MFLKSFKSYTATETEVLSVFAATLTIILCFFLFKLNFDSFNQIQINNQNQIFTQCLTLLDAVCLSYLCYDEKIFQWNAFTIENLLLYNVIVKINYEKSIFMLLKIFCTA